MKFFLLALIFVVAIIHLWLSGFFKSVPSTFHLWVIVPSVVLAMSLLLKIEGRLFSHVVPIIGILMGILATIPYYSVNTYTGTDGQAGLIYVVLPFYQLAALAIVVVVGLLVNGLKKL